MPSVRLEDLSPFGRAALKLDQEFAELTHAGAQIEKLDLETDGGLDDAIRILGRVARYGESLASSMQDFANALQEARSKAEVATTLVSERAQVVKQRRERQNELEGKLATLKDEVKAAGASLSGAAKPAQTDEDKRVIAAELERVLGPMDGFIAAARAVKTECAEGKFKRLERQADAMIESLEASRAKISRALGGR